MVTPNPWTLQDGSPIPTNFYNIGRPIQGAVSFSGADYKTVVFLPWSKDKLNEEIRALEKIFGDTTEDLRNASSIMLEQRLREELEVTRERIMQLKDVATSVSKGESVTRPVTLGDLQTLSVSVHRDKRPVRGFGRVYAKSMTRGPRTIAGSMIFTVINKHALHELTAAKLKFYNTGVGEPGSDSSWPELSTVLVDQLPPFDITILASNEVGDNSYAVLYGVEIINEGTTMSIQDLLTESVMQFVARDYDPLRPLTEKRAVLSSIKEGQPLTANDPLKETLNSRARRKIRLNPFV